MPITETRTDDQIAVGEEITRAPSLVEDQILGIVIDTNFHTGDHVVTVRRNTQELKPIAGRCIAADDGTPTYFLAERDVIKVPRGGHNINPQVSSLKANDKVHILRNAGLVPATCVRTPRDGSGTAHLTFIRPEDHREMYANFHSNGMVIPNTNLIRGNTYNFILFNPPDSAFVYDRFYGYCLDTTDINNLEIADFNSFKIISHQTIIAKMRSLDESDTAHIVGVSEFALLEKVIITAANDMGYGVTSIARPDKSAFVGANHLFQAGFNHEKFKEGFSITLDYDLVALEAYRENIAFRQFQKGDPFAVVGIVNEDTLLCRRFSKDSSFEPYYYLDPALALVQQPFFT